MKKNLSSEIVRHIAHGVHACVYYTREVFFYGTYVSECVCVSDNAIRIFEYEFKKLNTYE